MRYLWVLLENVLKDTLDDSDYWDINKLDIIISIKEMIYTKNQKTFTKGQKHFSRNYLLF